MKRARTGSLVRTGWVAIWLVTAGSQVAVLSAQPDSRRAFEELVNEMGRKLEACGTDVDCINALLNEISELSEQQLQEMAAQPAPTLGGSQVPVPERLPTMAEFIQGLQACGADGQCAYQLQAGTTTALQRHCAGDTMCVARGQSDIAMAAALAALEAEGRGPGSPPAQLVGADPRRAATIVAEWRRRLAASLPHQARSEVEVYAAGFPVVAEIGAPPLRFVESDGGADLRPAARDWAFALQGMVFAQAGLTAREHARYLDLAMWCFTRAIEISEEAEHLSNFAFFLNLLGRYDEARDVLAKARQLDPRHPDVRGNLAFALHRLGRSEAANREAEAALALDLAGEAREATGERVGEGVTVAPPRDWGLAYFRLVREHMPAYLDLDSSYRSVAAMPLDREFAVTGGASRGTSPRAVRDRQDQANQEALDQCIAAVQPAPSPCPLGSAISHPSCAGAASRGEARLGQLRYEKEICQCHLGFSERDVRYQKTFVEEQIGLAQAFDREWTPRLEATTRSWRRRILTINALYANSDPRQGHYSHPWPEQFHQLMSHHFEDLRWFAEEWSVDARDEFASRTASLRGWQQRCREAAMDLEAFEREFFALRPLKCATVSGKTQTINLALVKLTLFFPEGRTGDFASKFEFNLPFGKQLSVSGEAWESAHGAEGGKLGAGLGPVSAEIWGRSGGDWGGGVDFNLAAASGGITRGLPRAAAAATNRSLGEAAHKVADQLVKFDLKVGAKYDNRTGASAGLATKFESGLGFHTAYGTPPAWVRLRSRPSSQGRWPVRGPKSTIGGIPVAPGC